MPRKRGIASLLVMLMLACLMSVPAQKSHAAQGDVEWSELLSSGYMSPSAGARVMTHGNDSVTVGACGSSGSNYRVDTYDSAQNHTNTASGSTYPSICDNRSLAGADGTVYYTTFESGRSYLNIRRGGTEVAKHDFDFQCYSGSRYGYVNAMRLGIDGNAYAVVTNANECSRPDRLVAFSTATGSIMYSTTLSTRTQGTGDVAKMGIYDEGVVVLEENLNSSGHDKLSYFAYDGTRDEDLSCNVQASTDSCGFGVSMGNDVQTFFVNEAGTAYIDTTNYVGGTCPYSNHTLRYTTGGLASSLSRPSDCAAWLARILPGGKLVFAVPNAGTIKVWDSSGNELIAGDSSIKSGYSVTTRGPVLVDGTGHVVVERTVQKNGTSDKFVFVEQLQSNGSWLTLFETEQFATSGTDNFSFRATIDIPSVAFADGVLYATICSTDCNDGQESLRLYKVSSPGMGFEYPRSEMLDAHDNRFNFATLGDSFSSGEGVEPFDPNTAIPSTNECHRSEKAYSKLLVNAPGSRLRFNGFGFLACSGATIGNVNGDDALQYSTQPLSQISVLTEDVDAVAITVGGNNIDFAATANACNKDGEVACASALSDTYSQVNSQLESDLTNLYSDIRGEVRLDTEIFVLGYPQLFPSSNSQNSCKWSPELPGERTITQTELSDLQAIVSVLNQRIENAVDASGSHIHFIPVAQDFSGHDVCSSQPWLSDVFFHTENMPYVYHPNLYGQQKYAQLLYSAIVADLF